MQWQPATQRQWKRLGIVAAALAVLGTVALLGAAGTANADVQLQTDTLDVSAVLVGDVGQRVDVDVEAADVRLVDAVMTPI